MENEAQRRDQPTGDSVMRERIMTNQPAGDVLQEAFEV
jgi:hypothetical protein